MVHPLKEAKDLTYANLEKSAVLATILTLVAMSAIPPGGLAGHGDGDPPAGAGEIHGDVLYTGEDTGDLVVWVQDGPSHVQDTVATDTGAFSQPIAFSLTGLADGEYRVEGFLDANGNGEPDEGEPQCFAIDEGTGEDAVFPVSGDSTGDVELDVPCFEGGPGEGGEGAMEPPAYFGGVVNITITRGGSPITKDDGSAPGDVFIWKEGDCSDPVYEEGSRALGTCSFAMINGTTGTATISGLADGTYDWDYFLFEGGSGFFEANVTVTGATTQDIVEISVTVEVPEPGWLKGRVVSDSDDPEGTAVSGASVDVFGPSSFGFGETSEDGSFNVSVSAGTVGYDIRPPSDSGLKGFNSHCDPWGDFGDCLTIESGVEEDIGLVELGAGGVITGFVRDTEGDPMTDVEVNGFTQCPSDGPCEHEFAFDYIEPDGDGSYTLTVGAGNYMVEAFSFAGGAEQRVVAPGVEVTEGETTWQNLTIGGGGRITGQVTGSPGIPDVFLMVFQGEVPPGEFPGDPLAFAETNSTGHFDVSGLPDGQVTIMFEPPFDSVYKRGQTTLTVSDGETTWHNETLARGKALKGYVTDPDEDPVQDADVGLFPTFCSEGDDCFGGFSFTDDDGLYQVGGLEAETDYGMFVSPPPGSGLGSFMVDPFRGEDPLRIGADESIQWRNITLDRGISLRGNVTMTDGGAFPGGFFELWADAFGDAGWGGGLVQLNGDRTEGSLQLDGLAPGTYTLFVEAFGSNLAPVSLDGVTITSDDTVVWLDDEDLQMSAGVCITGTAKDGDGDPVSGAFADAFELVPPGSDHFGAFGWDVTDAAGAFEVCGLKPGEYGLRVEPSSGGGGLATNETIGIRVTDGDCTACDRGDVVLEAGVQVTGTVQDGEGGNVQGFLGIWNPQTGAGSGGPIIDGSFSVSVPAGTYEIEVWPDPFAHPELGSRTLNDQSVSDGMDPLAIELSPGGTLTGRILDAQGDAVRYAWIHVDSPDGFAFGTTGSDGRFRVSGVSASEGDSVEVFVEPAPGSSGVPTEQTITWAPEDGTHSMGDITLTTGQSLTVTLQRDGASVAFAEVDIWPSDTGDGGLLDFGGRSRTSDTSGQVTFRGLPDGTFDLAVHTDDSGYHFPQNVTIDGSDTSVTLDLTPEETLTVSVSLTGGGALADAEVEVYNSTTHQGNYGTTDENGEVALNLPPGEYTVKVRADDHKRVKEHGVTVTAGGGNTHSVELESTASGTISGSLTGGPTQNVTVVAVEESDSFVAEFAVSGSDGTYSIADVQEGTFTVFAVIDGTKYGCQDGVVVSDGATVDPGALDTTSECGEEA